MSSPSVTTLNSNASVESWHPPDDTVMVTVAIQPLVVPRGTRDAITNKLILNGMAMADFSGERTHGRYYTRKTYKSLDFPRRNPFTRALIEDVIYYTASVPPKSVIRGGRTRRRTFRNRRRYTDGNPS